MKFLKRHLFLTNSKQKVESNGIVFFNATDHCGCYDEDYWAEIDPFLDLLINIAKIRELSGNSKLNEFFEEGINSLLKNFTLEYGYAQKVRLDGSGPINGEMELKYMGLLIKGLIIANAVQKRVSLFKNRNMRLLATDR